MIAEFLTFIARIAGRGLSCASLAKSCARTWLERLNGNLGWFRTTRGSRIAVAIRFAKRGQGSKNMNNRLNARERRHLLAVKELPCGVCGAPGPSDAHHIEQGLQFTCIPLCKDCHQGSHNGIHGRRAIWNVTKKTELSVLNDTIEKFTR